MDLQRIGTGVADRQETFALLNRGYDPQQRSAGQWFETSREMWDYFLGVLPPLHFTGTAFVMSEAATGILSDAWIIAGDRAFCLAVPTGSQTDFIATEAAFRAHLTQEQAG